MKKHMRPRKSPAPSGASAVSRRSFMRRAAAGAGATAATLGTGGLAFAEEARGTHEVNGREITIPKELVEQADAPLPTIDFPMTGADVFGRACKEEGLAALFCCPGNYDVIHAIRHQGIPAYSGRHEGSMCHAADAFIRVTGEIAAASGTEGPGFTDMICAVAVANAARTPLLLLASNMSIFREDTEAGIQLGYQQPTTEGLKKYGKRLINPARVHEYAGYAFRQLRSGVPKPVHIDFPSEVARAKFESAGDVEYYVDKTRYRTTSKPSLRRFEPPSTCRGRPSVPSSCRATASSTAAPGSRCGGWPRRRRSPSWSQGR